MPPVILDVDTGVDDMVALLYAIASPEVDLIGATCVTGNVHVDSVTRNTLVTLELAGAGGVEVARGADKPLSRRGTRSRSCTARGPRRARAGGAGGSISAVTARR